MLKLLHEYDKSLSSILTTIHRLAPALGDLHTASEQQDTLQVITVLPMYQA